MKNQVVAELDVSVLIDVPVVLINLILDLHVVFWVTVGDLVTVGVLLGGVVHLIVEMLHLVVVLLVFLLEITELHVL